MNDARDGGSWPARFGRAGRQDRPGALLLLLGLPLGVAIRRPRPAPGARAAGLGVGLRSLLCALLVALLTLVSTGPASAAPLPDVVWTALVDKDVTIELTDGTTLPGHLAGFDAQGLVLVKADGRLVTLARKDVEAVRLHQDPPVSGGPRPVASTAGSVASPDASPSASSTSGVREGASPPRRGRSSGRSSEPAPPSAVIVRAGAPPWMKQCAATGTEETSLDELGRQWMGGSREDPWRIARRYGPEGTSAIAGWLRSTVITRQGASPLAQDDDVILAAAWVVRCGEGVDLDTGAAVLVAADQLGAKQLSKALERRLPRFEPAGIAFLVTHAKIEQKPVLRTLVQDWSLVTSKDGLWIGDEDAQVALAPDESLLRVDETQVAGLHEALLVVAEDDLWIEVLDTLNDRLVRDLPYHEPWREFVRSLSTDSRTPPTVLPKVAEVLFVNRLAGRSELLETALASGDEAVQLGAVKGLEAASQTRALGRDEVASLSDLAARGSTKAARRAGRLLR